MKVLSMMASHSGKRKRTKNLTSGAIRTAIKQAKQTGMKKCLASEIPQITTTNAARVTTPLEKELEDRISHRPASGRVFRPDHPTDHKKEITKIQTAQTNEFNVTPW